MAFGGETPTCLQLIVSTDHTFNQKGGNMVHALPMVEVWRGEMIESLHTGHAVVCDPSGEILHAWGAPETIIYPRSSVKMLQALPMVESGAGRRFGLTPRHLALACASHNGEAMHSDLVRSWLGSLGRSEADLRCGCQPPQDRATRDAMRARGALPGQVHHNCSGKHSGFLTFEKHIGGGPEYVEIDHPVQRACKAAFEEMTAETSPRFGIDGCSAPNFATSMIGLARGMARMADPTGFGPTRRAAARTLVKAMIAHPEMVAGTGRACTELMLAAKGQAVIKTGAEGVYVAILPAAKLGVALKITDGATRAAECAIAAILVRLGILPASDPATQKRIRPAMKNARGAEVGRIAPTEELFAQGKPLI